MVEIIVNTFKYHGLYIPANGRVEIYNRLGYTVAWYDTENKKWVVVEKHIHSMGKPAYAELFHIISRDQIEDQSGSYAAKGAGSSA